MKKVSRYIIILAVALLFLPVQTSAADGVIATVAKAVLDFSSFAISPFLVILGDILHVIILMPLQAIVAAVGAGLDTVIKMTIVDMSDTINNMDGINTAWKLTRDVMNIVFIFMLVYEAILLILGLSSTQKIGRWLGFLILAALLVNFSLFFTKVLIDASNIVTIGIYNVIIRNTSITSPFLGEIKGLAVPFITKMGITKMVDPGITTVFKDAATLLQMELFFILILLVAIFVFLSAIILFVVRYIILIILLMLSPIGFMGSALPFIKKYSDQWWESLNGQLLFPPLFMFFTWMSLTLMDSANFGVQNNAFTEGSTAADLFNYALQYSLVIGMMIATLVISKSTATKGSTHIKSMTSSVTAFAGGAVLGGSARLARNTVGRAGSSISDSEQMKRWATEGNAAQRVLARTGLAASNKAATSTFDARGTKSFGSLAKTTGFGGDFGKVDSKKETYKAISEQRIKDAVEREKRYKPSDLAESDAKGKLNENTTEGRKFKAEEEERKRQHFEKINSGEYANTKEGQELEKLKKQSQEDEKVINQEKADIEKINREVIDAENEQKVLTAQLAELEKRLAQEQTEEGASRIRNEITNFKTNNDYYAKMDRAKDTIYVKSGEVKKRKDLLFDREELKRDVDGRIRAIEYNNREENYVSEERRRVLATAGGTSVKKINNKQFIVDANGRQIAEATDEAKAYMQVDSAFAQRMGARAKETEGRSAVWRWTANTVGAATNTIGITSQPYTKRERRALAAKYRKEAKGKSNKDKIFEALKQETESSEPEAAAATAVAAAAPAADAGGAPADTGGGAGGAPAA